MMGSTAPDALARAPSRQAVRARRRLGAIGGYALVIAVVVVTIFPIYWMIATTVRPTGETTHFPPPLISRHVTLTSFRDLFAAQPIGSWLLRSTELALIATVICIVMAVLGAYTLSSMRWRGKGLFAAFLLITQMLPEALIVVPIFKIYTRVPIIHIDLRNQIAGLGLLDAAFILPIGVWVLKNLFDTVPREIREAALVDGAGPMRILYEIMLPLTLPGLVAVGVVAFFYSWNEYLFAQLMTPDKTLYVASVGLASMKTMLDTPIEQLLAAGLIFAIPPVFFYIVMQRYIVAGITAGAVKG